MVRKTMTPEERYESQLQTKKRFYQKHKHELLTKFKCECGGSFDVFHIKQHFNTKKHKKFETNERKQEAEAEAEVVDKEAHEQNNPPLSIPNSQSQ